MRMPEVRGSGPSHPMYPQKRMEGLKTRDVYIGFWSGIVYNVYLLQPIVKYAIVNIN